MQDETAEAARSFLPRERRAGRSAGVRKGCEQSLCFGWVLLFWLSSLPQDGLWRGQQYLTLEESSVSPNPERRRGSSVESTFF